jgi:DNA-directed RNA polymerase specialized sigma24 family protein
MVADGTEIPSTTLGNVEPSFEEFMQRVRAGDEGAAMALVQRYEPAIRRAVRVRLRDPRLRRLVETVDICQSVFASFFVRTSLGQYDLENPDKLVRLLVTIARNKVARQANREHAACRDQRRISAGADVGDCAAPGGSPSRQLAARELLYEARRRMTAEELRLLERREQGVGWAEIAGELGGTPDGQRVRLARTVARVSRELGLDEGPDE